MHGSKLAIAIQQASFWSDSNFEEGKKHGGKKENIRSPFVCLSSGGEKNVSAFSNLFPLASCVLTGQSLSS
jgi:hypothetical protein